MMKKSNRKILGSVLTLITLASTSFATTGVVTGRSIGVVTGIIDYVCSAIGVVTG